MEMDEEREASVRKIPLKLVRNVRRTDSKAVIVSIGGGRRTGDGGSLILEGREGTSSPSVLTEVRKIAANKMRISLANLRLFSTRGEELLAADEQHADAQITKGATLYVSAGEACVMDKAPDNKGTETAQASGAAGIGEVTILAKESFVDHQAVAQLKSAGGLPHVILAVGLPDLHVGASCPIGAAIATDGFVYPNLVGSDIGCGIMLARTSLKSAVSGRTRTVERWAGSLDLEGPWRGDVRGALDEACVAQTDFDVNSLGTVGRGNHFAELQMIERIEDADVAVKLGLNLDNLYLCVHSGSRGLGESILKRHTERFGSGGLPVNTEASGDYLLKHDQACKWAQVNRRVIASRFLDQLSATAEDVLLDVTHNSVEKVQSFDGGPTQKSVWLHRKGAAPSNKGPVVVPGSRGTFSYLVQPLSDLPIAKSGLSLAHGAGRALSRTAARTGGKARHLYLGDLTVTALGSHVVCEDRGLLYEERPEAYKDVACVIADMVAEGLCVVVAVLRPVLTYKMRSNNGE